MNPAELSGASHMPWHDMAFLDSMVEMLKAPFRDLTRGLDGVNRAAAEGKALDQLRERLADAYVEAEVCVMDAPDASARSEQEVHVCIVSSESLPPEVRVRIYRMLAGVNLRHGTEIRAEFLKAFRSHGADLKTQL